MNDFFKWWRDADNFSIRDAVARLIYLSSTGSRSFIHVEPFLKSIVEVTCPKQYQSFCMDIITQQTTNSGSISEEMDFERST